MVDLYERILLFEAKAACHCNHNIAYQTFRSLFKGDSSWKDGIKAIQQAETTCTSLLPILDQETQAKSSSSLLDITREQNKLIELSISESQEQLQAVVEELKQSRLGQKHAREAEEQRQCLAALRTTDYVAPKKLLPKRAAGTCEWFLQHPQYHEWLKADAPAFLWTTADPGCGKSVLAKCLVDDFIQITGNASHVCYFFFRAGTEWESTTAALCAMLHQLFCQDEGLLRKHGLPQYRQNGSKIADLFEPLWEMFVSVCQDKDRDGILCIIDALDECDASHKALFISRLAEMIADDEQKVKAKFLITSRPDKHLLNAVFTIFGSQPFNLIQVKGENDHETSILGEEINVVIEQNVERFHRTRKALSINDTVHEDLRKRIFEFKNRTYLWVSIVFSELQSKASSSKDDLLRTLQTLPAKVETAYESCLGRIPSAEIDDAKRILRIIVSAVRDLNLEELKIAFTIAKDGSYHQLDFRDETSVRIFTDTIRHLCGLLIRIEGSIVSLIHQTAREFLTTSLQAPRLLQGWEGSFTSVRMNAILAQCCIWYLTSSTFDKEWLKLEGGKWKPGVPFNRYLELHPFVEYSAKHWMLHFNLSGAIAGDDLCAKAVRLCEAESPRYKTWSKIYWSSFGRRAPPNTTDLGIAVAYGLVEVINELLRQGYNINGQDADGDTALHVSAIHSQESAAKVLLQHGASTTIKANDGNTPLHSTAARGIVSIVKLILEHDSETEEVNNLGRTPLHRAAQFGHPEAVKALLDAGAKANTRDNRGRTALHLASLLGREDTRNALRLLDKIPDYGKAIQILEESGADKCIADNDHLTASQLFSSFTSVSRMTRRRGVLRFHWTDSDR